MVTLSSTRTFPHTARFTRALHTCRACGEPYSARPGPHLGGIYCPRCLDTERDPVTAEHAWDLGGGG
jgi:hypothetical protein